VTEICKGDFRYQVDLEKTKEYYKTVIDCECGCCQNYIRSIRGMFPEIEAFLAEFGIEDIAKPDDIWGGYDKDDEEIDYIYVNYSIVGKMEQEGKLNFEFPQHPGIKVEIGESLIPHGKADEVFGNFFAIHILGLRLPRVVDFY